MSFVNTYTGHFQSYRHDVSDKARQYACGLMQSGSRKNMDRMAEVLPESKSRNLQQFLTPELENMVSNMWDNHL